MKTITLTGATGMIGLALIKQCISRGVKAYAFVRSKSSKTDRLLFEYHEIIYVD